MKNLFLILLLLPLVGCDDAMAEHHRGHAIARSDIVIARLEQALDAMADYEACAPMTEYDLSRFGIVTGYTTAALNLAKDARTAILDYSMTLHEIRRMITQPAAIVDGVRQPASATIRLFWVTAVLMREVPNYGPCPERDAYMAMRVYLNAANYQLSEFSWHINDAILEEEFGRTD